MTRLRWLPVSAFAAALTLGVPGCGGRMARAEHAFDEGRYPDAVGELRALEARAADWPPRARARYALTRGLSHLSCGDVPQAARWLGAAERAFQRDRSVLDARESGRLSAAWRSMGRMPGEALTSELPAAE